MCTLADFIVSFNISWDNLRGKIITLFVAIILVCLIAAGFLRLFSPKSKEDNNEQDNEAS